MNYINLMTVVLTFLRQVSAERTRIAVDGVIHLACTIQGLIWNKAERLQECDFYCVTSTLSKSVNYVVFITTKKPAVSLANIAMPSLSLAQRQSTRGLSQSQLSTVKTQDLFRKVLKVINIASCCIQVSVFKLSVPCQIEEILFVCLH